MVVECAGCERPIIDRFLLNVLDQVWHSACVVCTVCKSALTDKCYGKDGQLYCKDDFFKEFGTRCSGCGQRVSSEDLVRRTRDKVYHVNCFTCSVCMRQLTTGEHFHALDEHSFICKDDYIKSTRLLQATVALDIEDDPDRETKVKDRLTNKFARRCRSSIEGDTKPPNPDLVNENRVPVCEDDIQTVEQSLELRLRDGCVDSLDTTVMTKNGEHLTTVTTSSRELLLEDSNCSSSSASSCCSSSSLTNSSENTAEKDKDKENCGDDGVTVVKRRGPRTTIKAKQLETLKTAFSSSPRPTRQIREQLAQATGLNMRVIQVWFQNRRSKERRLKQMSSYGMRRHLPMYRNTRRFRPAEDPDLLNHPHYTYFTECGDYRPSQYPSAVFQEYYCGLDSGCYPSIASSGAAQIKAVFAEDEMYQPPSPTGLHLVTHLPPPPPMSHHDTLERSHHKSPAWTSQNSQSWMTS